MFNIHIYIYINAVQDASKHLQEQKSRLEEPSLIYIYIYIVNSADIVTHDLQFCKLCSFKYIYI